MKVWIRMQDGKELCVECERISITTSPLTGRLTEYEITGMRGKCQPIYMPPQDIVLVWREDEESMALQE